jgi:hypothetical protein
VNKNKKQIHHEITPEKTQAWSLALYPAVILSLVVFMIVLNRPITTDIIGLFIGLVTAGSLQAAVKKRKVENADVNRNDDTDPGVHPTSDKKLGFNDWRGPDDIDRWRNGRFRLRRSQMG